MPKFESTLHFSKYFTFIQVILLMGALISTDALPFSGVIKSALVVCLVGYFLWNLYSHQTWQAIGQDKEGWYLQRSGEKTHITLSGDSTLTGWVSVLRFTRQENHFKQSCLIFRDALPADGYRQLFVRLKYFNRETD